MEKKKNLTYIIILLICVVALVLFATAKHITADTNPKSSNTTQNHVGYGEIGGVDISY